VIQIEQGLEKKSIHKVALFSTEFMSTLEPKCNAFSKLIQSKKGWNDALKELRDPIAHRIPIYAIPQFLDLDEALEYQRKLKDMIESSSRLDFNRSDELNAELEHLGTYEPAFYYSDFSENRIYAVNAQIKEDLKNTREILSA
jgi:hypothetical protein